MSRADDTTGSRCAICGKPQDPQLRPFCSKRCADIDLGRWLKGNYVIPGRETDESDQGSTSEAPSPADDIPRSD